MSSVPKLVNATNITGSARNNPQRRTLQRTKSMYFNKPSKPQNAKENKTRRSAPSFSLPEKQATRLSSTSRNRKGRSRNAPAVPLPPDVTYFSPSLPRPRCQHYAMVLEPMNDVNPNWLPSMRRYMEQQQLTWRLACEGKVPHDVGLYALEMLIKGGMARRGPGHCRCEQEQSFARVIYAMQQRAEAASKRSGSSSRCESDGEASAAARPQRDNLPAEG
ncbi:uncharacterized protein LAESUDRAFT_812200 [Laetiporus sulphureus 93-53]|uniref:Uncharacterized protein n=1 Tax=Laetiporus sulphureus 93-53 TaxID=1314785 RepID=A0A165EJH7_9APHY|nr:uncharacterized protein LAESUDRAFT_812200 [Laetiporus sulphureus 93-53]KZT07181.1 hypothetical protein LAESUDRAFT_812200 [Laetiporus sulphureus 93-53]